MPFSFNPFTSTFDITGVNTLAKIGSSGLSGDITLTGGSNVTLTQSGQDISFAASSSPPSIGGTITSGALGSVLFVDTGPVFAQDNANLFWDSTNHRLGLGTSSPNQQLELTGNIRLVASITTAGIIYSGTNLLAHTYGGGAGIYNTFFGIGAGNLTNTSGGAGRNTGIGQNALHALADGYGNTIIGKDAGQAITDGYYNVAIGYQALYATTTGPYNVAIGSQALSSNTTGDSMVAIGRTALNANTTGSANLAVGYNSLAGCTSGNDNIAFGTSALLSVTTGNYNVGIGSHALSGTGSSLTGQSNNGIGYYSLRNVTTGSYNNGFGDEALYGVTTGTNNIGIGYLAGYINNTNKLTTGTFSTFIGDQSGQNSATQRNYATAIGAAALVDASNAMVLGAPDGGTGAVSVSIGIVAPLARLHLPAGTAIANTAPQKFTSGTKLTTPESGALEYNNRYYFTNSSLVRFPVGGTLFDHFTDVGNGTTVETDLYSDTIAVNTLAVNGDKLEAEYGGVFVSSATATREVKVYFGGTAVFDTGALTLSLSSAWTAFVSIIRVSSTVIRYMVSFTTEGAALSAYTAVGELTGLTLSNTNILKITGQAAGVGAATNDIVAKMGSISWVPAV